MKQEERKLKVLSAIIELYEKTCEPVGSKALCNNLDFSVSSATLRNDMAELVELGLLVQPHTSAGRIPSEKGYRLYINKLMNKHDISEDEKELITSSLSSCADDPEQLLSCASDILSKITNFVAISTAPPNDGAKVIKIEFVQTGRRTAMLIFMTSSGVIKNKLFRCYYDLTKEILRIFSSITNERFIGLEISKITPAFIQTVAASLGEMMLLMTSVLMAILEAAEETKQTNIRLNGQANLLFSPHFDLNSAKSIIEFLDKKSELIKLLLNGKNNSTNVLIGSEIKIPELINSSVIISHYTLTDNTYGAIAIIGPYRMNYAKNITSIEYLSSTVGKILCEFLENR